jgi:hypothetical protein
VYTCVAAIHLERCRLSPPSLSPPFFLSVSFPSLTRPPFQLTHIIQTHHAPSLSIFDLKTHFSKFTDTIGDWLLNTLFVMLGEVLDSIWSIKFAKPVRDQNKVTLLMECNLLFLYGSGGNVLHQPVLTSPQWDENVAPSWSEDGLVWELSWIKHLELVLSRGPPNLWKGFCGWLCIA